MAQFAVKFWQKTQIGKYIWGSISRDTKFFEYLALSHAFMSEIRFIPLFPAQWKLETPFLQTETFAQLSHTFLPAPLILVKKCSYSKITY